MGGAVELMSVPRMVNSIGESLLYIRDMRLIKYYTVYINFVKKYCHMVQYPRKPDFSVAWLYLKVGI
jgi:hypothetical protein